MSNKDKSINCISCGSGKVSTSFKKEKFKYGRGKEAVELTVSIPVRECGDCGFNFTDNEADIIRDEEVCRYVERLDRLRSDQIFDEMEVQTLLGLPIYYGEL
jgi:transcription elongation factor Elf1